MLLIFGNFSLLWRKQDAAYCAALVLERAATPLHSSALAHKQKDAHAAPHCFVKDAKTLNRVYTVLNDRAGETTSHIELEKCF